MFYFPAIICHALCKAGLLKLGVATHKWDPEPSQVDREKASSKNIIAVITNVSLRTNIIRPLFFLEFTSDFFKIMRCY